MPLTLALETNLHKLWGSQSWLQPAFSRPLPGTKTPHGAKKPPKRRLRAGLPAPRSMQNQFYAESSGRTKVSGADWASACRVGFVGQVIFFSPPEISGGGFRSSETRLGDSFSCTQGKDKYTTKYVSELMK